jgi:transposase
MGLIRWPDRVAVYVCLEAVDFRKGANSLALLVEQALGLEPFAEQIVVFRNRRATAVKVLYWERNGFCLWQKRLERERFHWPSASGPSATPTVTLDGEQLGWLLEGYDLAAWRPHRALQYTSML